MVYVYVKISHCNQ